MRPHFAPPRTDVWNPSDPVEDEIDRQADDFGALEPIGTDATKPTPVGVEDKDQRPLRPVDPRDAEDRPVRGPENDDTLLGKTDVPGPAAGTAGAGLGTR